MLKRPVALSSSNSKAGRLSCEDIVEQDEISDFELGRHQLSQCSHLLTLKAVAGTMTPSEA